MSRRTTIRGAALAALAGATLLALALTAGPRPAQGAGTAAGVRSAQLADQPGVDRASTVRYTAPEARAQAARRAAELPLPEGGNLNGIQWEAAGGTFSVSEVEGVVEHNVFCQWMRAADGPRRAEALEVLAGVPDWPAMRDGDGVVGRAVAEARAGGGETQAGVLADCVRSFEREAAYAAKRGLTPST